MTTVIHLASRRAAPTTGTPDPIQLHAEAHNALSMALHYLRSPAGNVPGASRKAVQALSALRRLVAVTRPSTNPCAKCPDNFPLPVPRDYFDEVVVGDYVARRSACDSCPSGAKPCLVNAKEVAQ